MRRIVIVLAACGSSPPPPPAAPPPAPMLNPALTPGEHRFKSGDTELVYHVAGEGTTCVVQPGGPGLGWEYLRMPELEKRVKLIYLEPAGTGASGARQRYSFEQYADDLEALRVATKIEHLCLIGHSAGGYAAMEYAIRHPEHLTKLILYATGAVFDEEWAKDRAAAIAARKDEPWFADAVDALEHPSKADPSCSGLERTAPLYYADWTHHPEYKQLKLRCWPAPGAADHKPPDLRDQLKAVHVPTLVAVGRHDFLFPPKWGQVIVDAIAGAKLVVFEHSGHMAHIEEPVAVADAFAQFIAL